MRDSMDPAAGAVERGRQEFLRFSEPGPSRKKHSVPHMKTHHLFLVPLLLSACASGPRGGHGKCEISQSDRGSVEAARRFLEDCGLNETLELTRTLVSFETVSANGLAKGNPAFTQMRTYLESWAAKAGLGFHRFGDDDAWEIGLGSGARRLGFVMHADVVPAGEGEIPEGWTGPPYKARVQDGKLYGRGTEDDKAPIAAVLVAMHTLQRFGLAREGQVLAILGTAEEENWEGMVKYAKTSTKPEQVISIDASYPVVIAESGFVAWKLALPLETPRSLQPGRQPRIERAEGGQFLTQVPAEASMTVLPEQGQTVDALRFALERIAHEATQALGPGFQFEVRPAGPRVYVKAKGRAIHSSEAERGHNALWLLARVAHALKPEENATAQMLELVHQFFVDDHHGKRLGLTYEHPLMGALLVAPTLLHTESDTISLGVNLRRPAGKSKAEMGGSLASALEQLRKTAPLLSVPELWVGEPAIADTSGVLVPTLMQIYQRVTGDLAAQPISIRGGTYARLFPGAVSFGPSPPGAAYTGHGADEYIELEVLDQMLRMIFESTLELTAPAQ